MLLSFKDVAENLHCGITKVKALVADGLIAVTRVGKTPYVRDDALADYLNRVTSVESTAKSVRPRRATKPVQSMTRQEINAALGITKNDGNARPRVKSAGRGARAATSGRRSNGKTATHTVHGGEP